MKPINVLLGIDRLDDSTLVEVIRQRQLHQNAINILTRVQRLNQIAKLAGGGRRGSAWCSDRIPTSSQARILFRTYTAEAGSSPTRTAARHGCTSCSRRSRSISSADLLLDLLATTAPSRSSARWVVCLLSTDCIWVLLGYTEIEKI